MFDSSNLKKNLRFCGHGTRFLILVISTLALTFIMANSLALNFTVICMVKEPRGSEGEFIKELVEMQELNITDPEPIYSLNEKSWLFSAVAIGNIIGTVPVTWANNVFGTRMTFFVYGMISGISTLLIPLCVSVGFIPVFFMRVLEGFGLTISLTSMGAIVSAWSSLEGAGMYISLLSMHIQFGAIVVMPVAGALCQSSIGWSGVYYILGGLTILFFSLFFLIYSNQPEDHYLVSQKELIVIKEGKMAKSGEHPPIPYKSIMKDIPVIGVVVSCLGGSFALQMMFQYGPTYLNKVLGFDLTKTGLAAALPYVLSVVVKLFAGPVSDMVTCISQRGRIIFFNTLSQLPITICFILMASLPLELGWLVQISYSLVNSFSGLNAVGVAKSVQLISQHHAHFIMTIMSLVNSIVILILPVIVTILAPDNTESQWAVVFYVLAVIVFLTMMFFNFVCQVEPREWAKLESDSSIIEISQKPSQIAVISKEFNDAACNVISGQVHNLQIQPLEEEGTLKKNKINVHLV